MALTTPPLIGLIALVIGRLRGMRLVTLVQDVYPDIAVALGTLDERNPATMLLDYLSRLVLRGADRIIVLGECMRERVVAKLGVDAKGRIDVIHNWADGAVIKPPQSIEANPFISEHNLEGLFVVLFSGNLGRVNEFETILRAALRLRDRHDIVFLFIGDGAKTLEIARYARENSLKNIRLLPYQPRGLLRYSLRAGHASLVTLAEGLAGLSVPSKTYAILAAGRPVLFVGDCRSEVARLVRENGCGEVVASGDGERLASVIEDLAADQEKIEQMGLRSRALFETSFDRPRAVNAYLEAFTKCLNTHLEHAEEIPKVGLPLGERTKP
jgi:glycosyltransferase involved in cell wall biosynthesis